MIHSTTTGTDYNPTGTNAEPNHYEYCWYRLPCGICTRTNSMCPLGKGEITWEYNKVTCNPGVSSVSSDWYVSLDDYTKCNTTSAKVPSTQVGLSVV